MITPAHLALILFVVANWGFSFVVIHVGLNGVPPLLLATLRFALAAFPLVLFVPRPRVPWVWLGAYGVATGVIQFGVAFTAMNIGISAGLASLVIQMQAFFTVLLSSALFSERLRSNQWLGLGIAACGVALIGTTNDSSATLPAVLLMLVAALGWGAANLVVKRVSRDDPNLNLFAFAVHGNAYAPVPLLLLSLAIEGAPRDWNAVTHLSLVSVLSAAYLAFIATVVCFGAWAWLIGRYSASTIAPFSLLVPVFGMISSAVLLREGFGTVQLLAALLVVAGLLVNVFGSRFNLKTRRIV
ncbi:MAG: EamA family transporter [Pleurocapsa sp. SU_196_0]|nr:EamA family transporter [Pleurocapsa sp. SU_196_0]